MRNKGSWKSLPYLWLGLMLLLLRGADLFVTYQITPDLSQEWNPLVSRFNFSWRGLMVVQALLTALTLAGFHRYWSRHPMPVDRPGLGLWHFVYYYFNGHEPTWSAWTQSFFRIPNRRYRQASGAFIGFVIVFSFTFASLFAIAHNLLILNNVYGYLVFVSTHSDVYFPAAFVVIVTSSVITFFVSEFVAYRKSFSHR